MERQQLRGDDRGEKQHALRGREHAEARERDRRRGVAWRQAVERGDELVGLDPRALVVDREAEMRLGHGVRHRGQLRDRRRPQRDRFGQGIVETQLDRIGHGFPGFDRRRA